MKFGKTFPNHQIPEWSVYYMDYKRLKKIIKPLDNNHNNDSLNEDTIQTILGTFFFELDRYIEQVDSFYNVKLIEYSRRLEKIITYTSELSPIEDEDDVANILYELQLMFKKLKWFGELNHKAFIKILKKLDKKLSTRQNSTIDVSHHNKEVYLTTRIDVLSFSNGTEIREALQTIDKLLVQVGSSFVHDEKKETVVKIPRKGDNEFAQALGKLILIDGDISDQLEQYKSKLSHKNIISLLIKASLANSIKAIDELLKHLQELTLFDESDINGRNFFHYYVISLGKHGQLLKNQTMASASSTESFIKDDVDHSHLANGFIHVLETMPIDSRSLLTGKDHYSRTPLHYSAQYGLDLISKHLINYVTTWKLIPNPTSIDDIEVWGDQENLTPLHLAILSKHPKTTQALISSNSNIPLTCHDLLLLAIPLNSISIIQALITQGNISVNYTNPGPNYHNESALYIACKLNFPGIVEYLLDQNADPEIGENVFGWTPVFVAASEGYIQIVKLLIGYGCEVDIVDDSGWLPAEHACLRGHLDVADLVMPKQPGLLKYDMYHPDRNLKRIVSQSVSSESVSSIERRPGDHNNVLSMYSVLRNSGSSVEGLNKKNMKPVKSFGHRYLNEDESMILITLGTSDTRDKSSPVELNKATLPKSYISELETALSLEITCRHHITNEEMEPPVVVDLPLQDHHGSATDPIKVTLKNHVRSADVYLTFDLIPTYQTATPKILARATSILEHTYTPVGPHLTSLHKTITVPLLHTGNLSIAGLVRFQHLEILPFTHPAMTPIRSDTYWKQLVSTRVIGHRGLGKNDHPQLRKSLQLGENTVESFIAASSLGASYVEFDVQLTKDFEVVVYHDFTVAESGVDIPMHCLTLEQFLGLNGGSGSGGTKNGGGSERRRNSVDDISLLSNRKPRSKSSQQLSSNGFGFGMLDSNKDEEDRKLDREVESQMNARMRLTKTWKDKGFKGNTRGTSVASNFATLKDLFRKIPANVGFNIELKYPMLDEAEIESMGEIAIDINHYLDTVLKVIYDENEKVKRDILFSSFHPDICLLLSLKQPTIPILFLTEAGTAPMADIRAGSLQNAIRFAKKWNLLGIVSAAGTLVKAPRLAQAVRSSGLVCVSYGAENNDPELAKEQMKAGVDAVIVDSVLAVREGLRCEIEALKDLEDRFLDFVL
ncbi:GDE1 [[Candida] subhashii]|uniref:GDE1 n=1 Tax=[Candida] subhashii TaxID=561895 RepID=A0A8J5QM91_9ASCO|nr:GDE1 [[Candida] subhashii]KAG7663045.1 GDE1 [[Candida] subhashii]